MLRQRQKMSFIQTAPHILRPNHWDLELLDAALSVTTQVIHMAGDHKRALEKIKQVNRHMTAGQLLSTQESGSIFNDFIAFQSSTTSVFLFYELTGPC